MGGGVRSDGGTYVHGLVARNCRQNMEHGNIETLERWNVGRMKMQNAGTRQGDNGRGQARAIIRYRVYRMCASSGVRACVRAVLGVAVGENVYDVRAWERQEARDLA